jgi:hypothetical protein
MELEKDKQRNIQLYADRVRAGLPLFEPHRTANSARQQIA